MIGTVWINPSLAYQLLPNLSIGAGLDYMFSQSKAERMVDQSALGASDGRLSLKATGDGWGYNLGVLFTPTPETRLGIAYRSGITVAHSGHLRLRNIAPAIEPLFGSRGFDTRIRTDFDYPDILSFGLAYRPAETWTLAFDLEQVRWSSFRSLDLELQRAVPAAGLTDSSTPLRWQNAWSYKFGVEYRSDERFALRGGYAYITSPVPTATLDPGNPDSQQHNLSIGVGYHKERLTVNVFYMAGLYEQRTVDKQDFSGKVRQSRLLHRREPGVWFLIRSPPSE